MPKFCASPVIARTIALLRLSSTRLRMMTDQSSSCRKENCADSSGWRIRCRNRPSKAAPPSSCSCFKVVALPPPSSLARYIARSAALSRKSASTFHSSGGALENTLLESSVRLVQRRIRLHERFAGGLALHLRSDPRELDRRHSRWPPVPVLRRRRRSGCWP
jgi:hypothetical protein